MKQSREMGQWLKKKACIRSVKKWRGQYMVILRCNSSVPTVIWEAKTGKLLERVSQIVWHTQCKYQRDSVSKKTDRRQVLTPVVVFCPPRVCLYTHTHTHTQTHTLTPKNPLYVRAQALGCKTTLGRSLYLSLNCNGKVSYTNLRAH